MRINGPLDRSVAQLKGIFCLNGKSAGVAFSVIAAITAVLIGMFFFHEAVTWKTVCG